MTLQEKCAATITSALRECDSHLDRLEKGSSIIGPMVPFSDDLINSIDEATMAYLDQFIFRFMKLQDSMGTRLIPSLYAFLKDDFSPVPFLDMLAELEQYGALESIDTWQFFRNLRNNLAHDYPETVKQNIATLNLLMDEWEKMANLYTVMRQYATDHVPGLNK